MVDMEVVRERVLRGAYVGIGSFASTFVENMIEDNLFDNDLAIGAAELAVGAGISVGVDEVFQNTTSVPNDAVEFAGYGIQGSAWASLADSLQTGQLAGSQSVTVRSDGGNSQTAQEVTIREPDEDMTDQEGFGGAPFQAEVG